MINERVQGCIADTLTKEKTMNTIPFFLFCPVICCVELFVESLLRV